MKQDKMMYRLKKTLDAQRYRHTLGVAETAKKMARRFGEDEERAELAGFLHAGADAEGGKGRDGG